MWFSNLLTLSVPDEGVFFRHVSCALNIHFIRNYYITIDRESMRDKYFVRALTLTKLFLRILKSD